MKVGFYRCISLLLAVAMCVATSGCFTIYHFVSSDYTTSDVEPVSQPKKLLYIAQKRSTWERDWVDLDGLRTHLATTYPTVFSDVRTNNTIDVTLNIALTDESQLEFLSWPSLIILICNLGVFTPWVESLEYKYTFFLSYDSGEDIVSGNSPIRTPAIKGSWDDTSWRGGSLLPWAPLVGWLFFPFYDYRYSTDEDGRYFAEQGLQWQKAHRDIYAALCMASFNKNPTVFDGPEVEAYRVRKEKEAREKALEEARKKKEAQRQALENLDYYIVRQSFDAQTNIGTYRVQFKNKVPEVKELVQLQKDLLAFCYTKLRENNLEFDSRYISVLQEDYHEIGKSLKLYEFTIKLGAVEILDLQYDNSTLLGTISIRLPGGNPTNARKWVTENLDRLVEEYNISADNPIEGEYQLTSEKMSADGTYTVAFEVVN